MNRRNAQHMPDEEIAALREQLAQIRIPTPRRPRRPRCRPADRAQITRQASSFGFVASASADTGAEAYRKARSLANAAAHEAFTKDYQPTLLRQGEHMVVIWHDPRAAWYGVVQPDNTILPMLSGSPSEVRYAARKALRRLADEAE